MGYNNFTPSGLALVWWNVQVNKKDHRVGMFPEIMPPLRGWHSCNAYSYPMERCRSTTPKPRRGVIIPESIIRYSVQSLIVFPTPKGWHYCRRTHLTDREPRRGGIIPQILSARELIISFDKFLKQTPEQIPSIFIANKSRLHDRECRGNNITPSGFSGFIASILLQQCHPFGVGFLVARESLITIKIS